MTSKFISISPSTGSPRISISPASSDELLSTGCRGKKRRLDHLTWEEKVQRKKLKNRVAAQTSRDRKKAKMEENEMIIQELRENQEILTNKCKTLEATNGSLMERNKELATQVASLQKQLDEMKTAQIQSMTVDCVKSETKEYLEGSAVSTENPLLKGNKTQLDSEMTQYKDSLWKIIAICLLYKTCSATSKTPNSRSSKNLPKACSMISSQTWKKALSEAMKMLPRFKAQNSDCLDQWWGPHQNSWNPAEIQIPPHPTTVSA